MALCDDQRHSDALGGGAAERKSGRMDLGGGLPSGNLRRRRKVVDESVYLLNASFA